MMIKAKQVQPGETVQEDTWEAFLPGVEAGFTDKNGEDIGPPAGLSWVRPVPWGFGKLMTSLYERYGWDLYMWVRSLRHCQ